jgi:glyoxylase-like metal-dependent hydrolase (beta-lactamase superfamily II)
VLASEFVQSKRGLILDADGAVLVDTSMIQAETEMMLEGARRAGQPARRIVLTHSHFDHSAGCQLLPQSERIAQRGAGEWMLSEHARNYLAKEPPEHPDVRRLVVTLPTLEIDGPADLRLAEHHLRLAPTPGHSPDMMSVLVEPERVLFAGDAVITCFPPVIEDGDSAAALHSYERIQSMSFDWLVPGHGPLLDRPAAIVYIDACRQYLEALRATVERFDDPGTPLPVVEAAAAGVIDRLPPGLDLAPLWHQRAVGKVWSERRAALAA